MIPKVETAHSRVRDRESGGIYIRPSIIEKNRFLQRQKLILSTFTLCLRIILANTSLHAPSLPFHEDSGNSTKLTTGKINRHFSDHEKMVKILIDIMSIKALLIL
jgi:predicted ABC-type ATPase